MENSLPEPLLNPVPATTLGRPQGPPARCKKGLDSVPISMVPPCKMPKRVRAQDASSICMYQCVCIYIYILI